MELEFPKFEIFAANISVIMSGILLEIFIVKKKVVNWCNLSLSLSPDSDHQSQPVLVADSQCVAPAQLTTTAYFLPLGSR